jgi:phosphoribosyl 1,2-cyclic phosphodiesterase
MLIRALASGSAGNCYYVTDGKTPILIECGLKMAALNRALAFRLSTIEAVLLSHEHMDHAMSAHRLIERGVPLYTGFGTAEFLDLQLCGVHPLRHGEPQHIGTWEVTPFMIHHDAQEPYGFQLRSGGETLVYLTDAPFTEFTFSGMTHIMIEANYDLAKLKEAVDTGRLPNEARRRILFTHLSIDNAIAFLKANDLSRVVEIWLIHMSQRNADDADFARRVAAATGKVVRLP